MVDEREMEKQYMSVSQSTTMSSHILSHNPPSHLIIYHLTINHVINLEEEMINMNTQLPLHPPQMNEV